MTYGERLRTWGLWVGRRLLAPGAVLVIVLGALLLVCMGAKDLQIGGLLGRLLGRKTKPLDPIGVANTVPPTRVGDDGQLIPIGKPDKRGQTQVAVVPIHEPNLFSDPTTVRFTPPNESKPVEVRLPVGVTNKQVAQVIVVRPEVVAVTVRDTSGVRAERVDELLRKYGGP